MFVSVVLLVTFPDTNVRIVCAWFCARSIVVWLSTCVCRKETRFFLPRGSAHPSVASPFNECERGSSCVGNTCCTSRGCWTRRFLCAPVSGFSESTFPIWVGKSTTQGRLEILHELRSARAQERLSLGSEWHQTQMWTLPGSNSGGWHFGSNMYGLSNVCPLFPNQCSQSNACVGSLSVRVLSQPLSTRPCRAGACSGGTWWKRAGLAMANVRPARRRTAVAKDGRRGAAGSSKEKVKRGLGLRPPVQSGSHSECDRGCRAPEAPAACRGVFELNSSCGGISRQVRVGLTTCRHTPTDAFKSHSTLGVPFYEARLSLRSNELAIQLTSLGWQTHDFGALRQDSRGVCLFLQRWANRIQMLDFSSFLLGTPR